MRGYVFRMLPPRPTFAFDMSEDERATMTEHVAYWSRLTEQGRVLAFGPVADPSGPYGIGIVLATDDEEMAALRDGDPARSRPTDCTPRSRPVLRLVTPDQIYEGGPPPVCSGQRYEIPLPISTTPKTR